MTLVRLMSAASGESVDLLPSQLTVYNIMTCFLLKNVRLRNPKCDEECPPDPDSGKFTLPNGWREAPLDVVGDPYNVPNDKARARTLRGQWEAARKRLLKQLQEEQSAMRAEGGADPARRGPATPRAAAESPAECARVDGADAQPADPSHCPTAALLARLHQEAKQRHGQDLHTSPPAVPPLEPPQAPPMLPQPPEEPTEPAPLCPAPQVPASPPAAEPHPAPSAVQPALLSAEEQRAALACLPLPPEASRGTGPMPGNYGQRARLADIREATRDDAALAAQLQREMMRESATADARLAHRLHAETHHGSSSSSRGSGTGRGAGTRGMSPAVAAAPVRARPRIGGAGAPAGSRRPPGAPPSHAGGPRATPSSRAPPAATAYTNTRRVEMRGAGATSVGGRGRPQAGARPLVREEKALAPPTPPSRRGCDDAEFAAEIARLERREAERRDEELARRLQMEWGAPARGSSGAGSDADDDDRTFAMRLQQEERAHIEAADEALARQLAAEGV